MIPALILLAVAVAFRIALPLFGGVTSGGWFNFSPITAIALCGAVAFPKRLAIALPLLALFLSDVVLNLHYHVTLVSPEMLVRYLALAGVCGIGFWLRNRASLTNLLLGSLTGSILFYLFTNTGSWIGSPAYAKTATGLLQALTIGDPTVQPPAWAFLRNSVASDLIFTTLFAMCLQVGARVTGKRAVAKTNHPVPETN